jgi:hypothetical protein
MFSNGSVSWGTTPVQLESQRRSTAKIVLRNDQLDLVQHVFVFHVCPTPMNGWGSPCQRGVVSLLTSQGFAPRLWVR